MACLLLVMDCSDDGLVAIIADLIDFLTVSLYKEINEFYRPGPDLILKPHCLQGNHDTSTQKAETLRRTILWESL